MILSNCRFASAAGLLTVLLTIERSESLDKRNHRYENRIHEISKIIKEHFTENLSLSDLADMVHLSAPYLSKFFIEHFGMNYLSYLKKLRLDYALQQLLSTDKTIEDISADSGFPNSHAFTESFKKAYGILPSAYRRAHRVDKSQMPTLTIEQHDYMAGLKKHLKQKTPMVRQPLSMSVTDEFSAAGGKKMLRHSWRHLTSIGQASDILLGDVQNLLKKTQNDIGYDYIFFNGIFSDDLYVFSIDDKNIPHYNFTYVDMILDFLLQIHLKPFIQFSYMPSALAKHPNHILFRHLISPPKSISMWCDLIYAFMTHIVSRYGMDEVLCWKFGPWHLPDTPSRLFGFDNDEDFYHLYEKTYRLMKQIHPQLCFGSPCTFYINESNHSDWYLNFLRWSIEHDCKPDFISFTFYDLKLATERTQSKASFGFVDPMVLNPEPNGLKRFIAETKKNLSLLDMSTLPVYVCEWNNTPSQQDLLNDTCYKSCYIVKNILENYDRLDGLSYWSLTDLMAESALPNELLFGGLGLFTKNGIPKASYHAMTLLAKLGDSFLAKGKNWFATKSDSDIRIMAYHYKHISKIYTIGERFDMTETDRYAMFEPTDSIALEITISDMADREYDVSEFYINRMSGSLYDAWVNSGCLDPVSSEELCSLGAQSTPAFHKSKITVSSGKLKLHTTLDLLEVKLIVIR